MKKTITQSIGLALLVVIAFMANQVVAGNPAVQSPGGFPANNTPFPVTVGAYQQIKGAGAPPASGGGLAVKEFFAWANASFDKDVGIQGILTGKPISAGNNNSNLVFGKPVYTFIDPATNQTRTANNIVDVSTTGWTYAQDGWLYTPEQKAGAALHQPLCANTAGEIIRCTGVPPITPLPFTP